MEEIFGKLRQLQDILSQRIVLEHDIQEIPKVLTTQEGVLAKFKKTFIEQNQDYERAKVLEAEFRNLLMDAEHNREEAEKRMELISTQREYEALEKEIADSADKEQRYRKDLQQQERTISDLTEQMKQTSELVQQQEKELAERRASVEQETTEKKTLVEQLQAQEQELIPELDSEVLFKFERIIRNKMGRGIVAIKGGVCTGCHMILPAQFANTVRTGEEIVFCPYCSRILFYEDADLEQENFFDNDSAGSLSDLDDLDDEYYEDDADDEEEEKVNIDFEE
jgi:predicted  nucleic acid-binding Zn-ribbon protein